MSVVNHQEKPEAARCNYRGKFASCVPLKVRRTAVESVAESRPRLVCATSRAT